MSEQNLKQYTIIATLIVVSIGIISLLNLGNMGPTGFVTFNPGIPTNTTFYTQDIALECSATTQKLFMNITAIATHESGLQKTAFQTITGQTTNLNLTLTEMTNGQYTYVCVACTNETCEQNNPIPFFVSFDITTSQIQPVINLTFDDQNNPWRDYSNLYHAFAEQGSTTWEDENTCKWFGCADFRATSGDFIESTSKFTTPDGMALSFWINPTERPTGANSQAYYEIGTGDNQKYAEEGDYGLNTKWKAETQEVGGGVGPAQKTLTDRWTHYFVQYDEASFKVWKNGELIKNEAQSYGNLKSGLNDILYVGKGAYGIDLTGYMDELLVWNRADFTDSDVQQLYDSQKEGTPPELDLYVKNATYILPYDWTSPTNELDLTGNLQIQITIGNIGQTESSGTFTTKVYLDDAVICSKESSLGPLEEEAFTCDWPKEQGWHTGYVKIDANNDVNEAAYRGGSEDNNIYYIYIPMESHPRFRFNKDDWDNILEPEFTDNSNEMSYASYAWYKSFVSEDFNPSWTATDVDPRAKKGFTNALNCYLNNYAPSTACTYAKHHLDGWLLDTTNWGTADVQALHEVIHVAATYDIMFPSFTQQEAEEYGQKIHDICLTIYERTDVQPHNDPDEPTIDNGKGFGSGLAGPCYMALGDNPSNPNMMWDDPQNTVDKSTIFYWNRRFENFLKGQKADPEGIYPEGMLYHWYSRYHIADILWFMKRTEISTIPQDYQDVLCSYGKEATRNILDHTYNGNTLRGDEDNVWRQISFGDTNSYENIGSDGIHGWDVITTYGLLCDEQDVKSAMLKLRDLGYETGEYTRGPGLLYYYPLLKDQATPIEDITDVMSSYSFAKSFDRLTYRKGYTYDEDTMFIMDAGDEATGGHPAAEFSMFAYVYGEPFLDFTQVPYEDDVRSEVWMNTISFTQNQGTGYNTVVGQAEFNQYYGGSDQSGTYPNFNYMPDAYRGDVTDTIGVENGMYAAAHTYKPYTETTEPIIRDYVIFDDLLVQADYVKRSSPGMIYDNWLNIYNEFPSTISGNQLKFNRAGTNKYYEILPMWSSAGTINLAGGDSGKKYCFKKTNCNPGGKGNYGKYYHYINGTDVTNLFAHHWYQGADLATITLYNSADKGIRADYGSYETLIKMDTNEDGTIAIAEYSTDGWSLAQKQEIIAATGTTTIERNSTEIYSSSQETSAYLDYSTEGQISATVSAMQSTSITIYLEGYTSASLEIDGQSISGSQYTIASGKLTTTISEGNHEILITTAGDVSPTIIQDEPQDFFFSSNSSLVSFSCNVTDDQNLASVELLTNESGTLSSEFYQAASGQIHNFQVDHFLSDGTYLWACKATDNASQTKTTTTRTIIVGEATNTAPVVQQISPEDEYTTFTLSNTFSCNTTDAEANLQSITLLTNTTGIFTETYTIAAAGQSAQLSKQLAPNYGNYLWACKATDSLGQITQTNNRTINIIMDNTPPNHTNYDGDTTDFETLPSLINVSNITLESTSAGKIMFTQPISNLGGIDFDNAVNISPLNITIDTSAFAQLNVSANLSFYDVTLTTPVLKKDGVTCVECGNGTYENNTYQFSVTHFSSYTLEEYQAPPPEETTTTTTTSSGSSGGGGGGKTTKVPNDNSDKKPGQEKKSDVNTKVQDAQLNQQTENLEQQQLEQPTPIVRDEEPNVSEEEQSTSGYIFTFASVFAVILVIIALVKMPIERDVPTSIPEDRIKSELLDQPIEEIQAQELKGQRTMLANSNNKSYEKISKLRQKALEEKQKIKEAEKRTIQRIKEHKKIKQEYKSQGKLKIDDKF